MHGYSLYSLTCFIFRFLRRAKLCAGCNFKVRVNCQLDLAQTSEDRRKSDHRNGLTTSSTRKRRRKIPRCLQPEPCGSSRQLNCSMTGAPNCRRRWPRKVAIGALGGMSRSLPGRAIGLDGAGFNVAGAMRGAGLAGAARAQSLHPARCERQGTPMLPLAARLFLPARFHLQLSLPWLCLGVIDLSAWLTSKNNG